MGKMQGKLWFRWTGPYWITREFKGSYQLGTLAGDVLDKWVNSFRLKLYHVPIPKNPFEQPGPGGEEVTVEPTPTTEPVPSTMTDE